MDGAILDKRIQESAINRVAVLAIMKAVLHVNMTPDQKVKAIGCVADAALILTKELDPGRMPPGADQ